MRIERTGGSDLPPELPTQLAPAMRRAVVCDRDESTRAVVAGILREDGFEVAGAADARELVESTSADRPDVVVLNLATDDDLTTLAQVTALRIAPVVVLAADSAPHRVAAARDAGALAYLTRSPTRTALIPAVEVAIARYAEMARLAADVAAAGRRLESRKIIDRAKGLLMAHRRMSEPEAFRWIQRTAMDRRKTSVAIAAQVVAELGDVPRHRAAS